jgi:hypothetical protein
MSNAVVRSKHFALIFGGLHASDSAQQYQARFEASDDEPHRPEEVKMVEY